MKVVSVVILNWNGLHLLRTYLPQVVANTPADVADIVVADNASTDGSLDYVRQTFPQVGIIAFDRNHGFAGGYNRALQAIGTPLTVLLNSDAAPDPGWTEPLLRLFDAEPDVAAAAPKILSYTHPDLFEYAGAAGGFVDWLGYPFCRGRIMDTVEADRGQYDTDIDAFWASGAALAVRTTIYRQLGGLDEDFFAHMEEIDLCWRMLNTGFRVVACGHASVRHLGGGTLSQQNPHKTYLNFRNNLLMLVKNYNTRLWPAVIAIRLVLDGLAGLRFAATGHWADYRAIVLAHWHFFARLRATMAKRRHLAAGRSRHLPDTMKRYSVMWRYFARRRTVYSDI